MNFHSPTQSYPSKHRHHQTTMPPYPAPSLHQLPSSSLPHHHDHQHYHQATCNCINHNCIPSLHFTKKKKRKKKSNINLSHHYPHCKQMHVCQLPSINHKLVKRKNMKYWKYLIEI
ncbi:hypothetical protein ACB098_10G005000 [Castanea mollissima]